MMQPFTFATVASDETATNPRWDLGFRASGNTSLICLPEVEDTPLIIFVVQIQELGVLDFRPVDGVEGRIAGQVGIRLENPAVWTEPLVFSGRASGNYALVNNYEVDVVLEVVARGQGGARLMLEQRITYEPATSSYTVEITNGLIISY